MFFILSGCTDKLAMYQTNDILYQFNGGWLYNRAEEERTRREIDRELSDLTSSGKVRDQMNGYATPLSYSK